MDHTCQEDSEPGHLVRRGGCGILESRRGSVAGPGLRALRGARPTVATRIQDQVQEGAHSHVSLERVTKAGGAIDRVVVASPHSGPDHDPRILQIDNDLLDRPLGDVHQSRHISKPYVRVSCQRHHHMSMVGQEHPLARFHPARLANQRSRISVLPVVRDICLVSATTVDYSQVRDPMQSGDAHSSHERALRRGRSPVSFWAE